MIHVAKKLIDTSVKLGRNTLLPEAIDGIVEDYITEAKDNVYKTKKGMQIFKIPLSSGTTSNGGDLWISNPGQNNSVMIFSLVTVNGASPNAYIAKPYRLGTAHYIRLYSETMVVQKQQKISYSALIITWL